MNEELDAVLEVISDEKDPRCPKYQEWFKLVKEDGLLLKEVPPEFKTVSMCLVALVENNDAYDYVPESLHEWFPTKPPQHKKRVLH